MTAVVLTFLVADGARSGAEAQNRTLEFKQLHTGETLSVTYRRGSRYDQAALNKINYILRDWRRNEATKMDPKLLDLVWEVRQKVGANAPIYVLSGYRSPVTNAMLRSRSSGVAKFSQHMVGKALDFYIPGVPLSKLRETGLKMQVGGVGYYPTSGSPFVHLDTGSVRHWPRMTRSQLAQVFPDGRTMHIPSDGKPMSGYNQVASAQQNSTPSRTTTVSGGGQQVAASSSRLDPSAPVTAASTGGTGGRNFIAALFDSGEDGDEEDASGRVDTPAAEARASAPTPPAATRPSDPARPTVVASLGSQAAVRNAPIPRTRPASEIEAAKARAEEPPAEAAPATAVAEAPIPTPRPTVVASLDPAETPDGAADDTGTAADEDGTTPAAAEAPVPAEKPVLTAEVQPQGELPQDEQPMMVAMLPRERPLIPAEAAVAAEASPSPDAETIGAMIADNSESATASTTATALASQDAVATMAPFSQTFTGQQIPLRDKPVLVAIDHRPEALDPYMGSGTCLRDETFVSLRHPDQTDIGALTTLAGPVVVNYFDAGPQLVYPMRRFTGPAVAPLATRSYQVAFVTEEELTTGTVPRSITFR